MSKKRLNLISSIITGNINRILKLDPEVDNLLKSLENENLWLYISDWHLLIHISADSNNNKLNLDCFKTSKNLSKLDELLDDNINKDLNKNQAHQLLIYGKAHNFIKLSRTQNPQEVFQDKDMNYDGSFNILLHYHRFYQQLDLDLTTLLTSLLGDHLGGFLSQKIKPFVDNKKENCHKYKEKLVDYLEREKRVIVPKEEVEDWIEDISQLVQDVERIEAKM
jgi:ubiquinone biosynthesis protein UbiJ